MQVYWVMAIVTSVVGIFALPSIPNFSFTATQFLNSNILLFSIVPSMQSIK